MAGVRAVILNDRGAVCCVRHSYGARDWNVPGGGVEQDESLLAAVHRETLKETGLSVRVQFLIGVYSVPASSDLVAAFSTSIEARDARSPDEETTDVVFASHRTLPTPMHPCVTRYLQDALDGRRGVVRVLNLDGTARATLDPGT